MIVSFHLGPGKINASCVLNSTCATWSLRCASSRTPAASPADSPCIWKAVGSARRGDQLVSRRQSGGGITRIVVLPDHPNRH
jgi:hypothetical protein